MNDMELIRDAYAGIEAVVTVLREELVKTAKQDELEYIVLTPDATRHIIEELTSAQAPLVSILESLKKAQQALNLRAKGLVLPDTTAVSLLNPPVPSRN